MAHDAIDEARVIGRGQATYEDVQFVVESDSADEATDEAYDYLVGVGWEGFQMLSSMEIGPAVWAPEMASHQFEVTVRRFAAVEEAVS